MLQLFQSKTLFVCLWKQKKMMSYVLHPPKKSLAEPDKAHKQNSAVAHNWVTQYSRVAPVKFTVFSSVKGRRRAEQ